MIRKTLPAIAIATTLAVMLAAPAEAGSRHKKSAKSGHAGSTLAMKQKQKAGAGTQALNNLGNRPATSANGTAASIFALGVYLQWRRKCLDNILPECP
jgi:hypothetical protein